MSRTERVAVVLAVATIAWWWTPIFRDHGIVAGLFWLAVTIGSLFLIIAVAGSSRKDPEP